MTLVKIYALEDPKETNVISTLGEGEHLLGRGDLLNCNDKRVSRKHAIVTVANSMVTIKAVHINPCFFKAADGSNITILPKDTSVILNDGDHFALLADAFWFRVRVILNNTDEYAENVNKELLEDTTKQNEIVCTSRGNNILSPLNVEDVSLNGPICINNIPSTSKRCNDDSIPEAVYKRQKTSKENEDCEPNKSMPDENVCSNGESKLTSQSNLELLLGTSQNISNTDTTREKNLVDIDSVKLINNLKAIVEEDYGSGRENPKKQDPQNTSDDNLNSSAVKVKQEIPDETVKVKEKKPDVEDEEDKNNEGETADVNNSVKVKEEKPDVEDEKETGETADVNNSNVTVKIEQNVVPVSQNNTNEQGEASSDITKNDPNDASCSTDNQKKKIRRERCWYAPNCYRKNPIHQVDFSHPGDDDYDSDPEDDRPVCPFGASCYRRNIDHRRQFLHINPPAPKPNTDDGKVNKKRRTPKKKQKSSDSEDDQSNDDDDNNDNSTTRGKRKAAMKKTYFDSPLDDYDYNDPFIDDASSDEFKLSSEGDDDDDDDTTDWDDSQKVDEQSQETRRLLKEAKRFTKGKGKK